jgi:hypothetical protein
MSDKYTTAATRPSRLKAPKSLNTHMFSRQGMWALCAELGKGNTVEFSCRKAGFSAVTLYRQTQIGLARGWPMDVLWIARWKIWQAIGKHWPDASDEFKNQMFLQISEGVHDHLNEFWNGKSAEIVNIADHRKPTESE